jgi:hypothetical protein
MLQRSSHLTKGDQRVVGLWWPALNVADRSCGLVSYSVSAVTEMIKGLFSWDPGGARGRACFCFDGNIGDQLRWHMRMYAISLLFRNNEPTCKRLNVDAKFVLSRSRLEAAARGQPAQKRREQCHGPHGPDIAH